MATSKGPLTRKLAQLVKKETGVRVKAGYESQSRGTTSWHLEWPNGPTVETMRKVADPMAETVPGLDFAVGYRRTGDDRHLVAAWMREAAHDDQAGAWSIDTAFARTGFPDDIADNDPVWAMVDYAFAAFGGPTAYAHTVVQHVGRIGMRGLFLEYWLDQHDAVDAPDLASVVELLLVVSSALSDDTLSRLRGLIDTMISEVSGRSARRSDPRAQVLIAEAIRGALVGPLDGHQRRQALLAVAEGTPLYRLSTMLGKSASTLSKRWPAAEFNADLAPLAWLRTHGQEWTRACANAVAEVRALGDDIAQQRDVWQQLHWLELEEPGPTSLRQLLPTPEAARKLLAAVADVAERALRERRLSRQLQGAGLEDDDVHTEVPGPALRELADLLAQYDAPPAPQRRGGARTPRSRRP